jgi:hypothetical protein
MAHASIKTLIKVAAFTLLSPLGVAVARDG